MKPKKKTAGKSEKRKFHPLRRQIEFWFIGLFLLSMVITTVINGLFLEHYYISKKTDVLQEAAKTEDTSNTTYKTVQELYEYFTEKMSGTAASLINGSAAAQSTNSTNNTNSTQNSTSAQSTAEQMNQAALVGQEFDFSTIDSIVEQMFSESTPLS